MNNIQARIYQTGLRDGYANADGRPLLKDTQFYQKGYEAGFMRYLDEIDLDEIEKISERDRRSCDYNPE